MAEALVQKVLEYVAHTLTTDGSGQDWYHTERVLRTAQQLQSLEGGIELTDLARVLIAEGLLEPNEEGTLTEDSCLDLTEYCCELAVAKLEQTRADTLLALQMDQRKVTQNIASAEKSIRTYEEKIAVEQEKITTGRAQLEQIAEEIRLLTPHKNHSPQDE
jgi:hypothetical protein